MGDDRSFRHIPSVFMLIYVIFVSQTESFTDGLQAIDLHESDLDTVPKQTQRTIGIAFQLLPRPGPLAHAPVASSETQSHTAINNILKDSKGSIKPSPNFQNLKSFFTITKPLK